ncbi:helix-turn-helix domain-containing protein [Clostridium magnum]|uniref:Transcriptional repressor DicA n=1 Tax=Clostridium magnum DSM 2767 TaxID=1121326 RepID=A0A162QNE7_9CLOT|nr:helix-turn-helix transcriptional regulator [Clostridium magnum]KZL88659.1 transcriptional repressor DicA [Clostridium magnum DSM 2767]KZL88749.1 transcriptional repressor DicA [Clostridium magnum DSM 2767]
MDIKRIIANNIYILRTKHDLTQQEFADKLSVKFTRGHISRIELANHIPSAEFIKAVSDAFNVSADWIMGTTGKEIPESSDTPIVTNVTTREVDLLLSFRALSNEVQHRILDLIQSILKSTS